MQNTRQRILNYLNSHVQASAPELSTILDQTQANIRHHLNLLEKQSLIEVVGQSHPDRRGRPTYLYRLTRKAQENALDTLSSALLHEIQSARTERQRTLRLSNLAKRLAGYQPNHHNSVTIRLGVSMQRLNDLHYQAHWEAHADAPHIYFKRCPYAEIVNQHPELCRMDALMLQNMIGFEFEHAQKISRTNIEANYCHFVLKSS